MIDVYHNQCNEENFEPLNEDQVAPPSFLERPESSVFKNSEDLSHPQILVSQTANSKTDEALANQICLTCMTEGFQSPTSEKSHHFLSFQCADKNSCN